MASVSQQQQTEGFQIAILHQQSENFKMISQSLAASIQSMEEKFSEKIINMEEKFLNQKRKFSKHGSGKKVNIQSVKSDEVSDLGHPIGSTPDIHSAVSRETSGLGQREKSTTQEPQAKKQKLSGEEEFEYEEHENSSDFASDDEEEENESDDHSEVDMSSYTQNIDDFLHTKPLNDKAVAGNSDVFEQALLDLVEEEYG